MIVPFLLELVRLEFETFLLLLLDVKKWRQREKRRTNHDNLFTVFKRTIDIKLGPII